MSGGSYNYLHMYRLGFGRRDDIERMAARLDELGYADTWAGRKTRKVLALLDEANAVIERLDDAWHAVEWYDSRDYSSDQVAAAIARGTPPGKTMHPSYSEQYGMRCVMLVDDDTDIPLSADTLIAFCRELGAVRHDDGVEYCVQLRPEVGPELWTGESLRRSLSRP